MTPSCLNGYRTFSNPARKRQEVVVVRLVKGALRNRVGPVLQLLELLRAQLLATTILKERMCGLSETLQKKTR